MNYIAVGLDSVGNVQPKSVNGNGLDKTNDMNTTSVPMELEPDTDISHTHTHHATENASQSTINPQAQDDLEMELRELLEAGNNSLATTDDVAIEQMLLD